MPCRPLVECRSLNPVNARLFLWSSFLLVLSCLHKDHACPEWLRHRSIRPSVIPQYRPASSIGRTDHHEVGPQLCLVCALHTALQTGWASCSLSHSALRITRLRCTWARTGRWLRMISTERSILKHGLHIWRRRHRTPPTEAHTSSGCTPAL